MKKHKCHSINNTEIELSPYFYFCPYCGKELSNPKYAPFGEGKK